MRRLLAAALFFAAPLSAQQTPLVQVPVPAPVHSFGWVVDGSFEFGGDLLLELTFTDGSKQKIYLGQGGTASFGAEIRPKSMPNLGIRALAGVKFTTTAADDANISFTRIPIEVVGSYYLPRDWRVGAGLAYHATANFNGDGFTPDVSFDPAAGATLELGWKAIALTYTAMQYKTGGNSYDASAIGVSLNWVFGKR